MEIKSYTYVSEVTGKLKWTISFGVLDFGPVNFHYGTKTLNEFMALHTNNIA